MHRVIKDVGARFGPIEEALATVFLPALLGGVRRLNYKTCLTLPVRQAELDIPKLAKKAVDGYRISLACTNSLTESLLNHTDLDAAAYNSTIKEARARMRKMKALLGLADHQLLCNAKVPFVSRRMKRSKEAGVWLNNLPNTLNSTVLSEEEFCDILRLLRFGLTPLELPSKCDECDQKFDIDHAMHDLRKGRPHPTSAG
jgi:hypothetical protein